MLWRSTATSFSTIVASFDGINMLGLLWEESVIAQVPDISESAGHLTWSLHIRALYFSTIGR